MARPFRPRKAAVPLDIQMEAACAAVSVNHNYKVKELLLPYGYPDKLFVDDRQLKKFFTFSPLELLDYLRAHPRQCKDLFDDSGDKRYSPSTYMQMTRRKTYLVGIFDPERGETNVQEFDSLAEAATDYVLYSLRRGRLRDTPAGAAL